LSRRAFQNYRPLLINNQSNTIDQELRLTNMVDKPKLTIDNLPMNQQAGADQDPYNYPGNVGAVGNGEGQLKVKREAAKR